MDIGQTCNGSAGHLYVPSSMLSYGMITPSDLNFLERTQAADCYDFKNSMQSALEDPGTCHGLDSQPDNYGLHDYIAGLLQETSTNDDFMFADFLNLNDPQLENNIDTTFEKHLPDITSTTGPPEVVLTTHPPDHGARILSSNDFIDSLNSNQLDNSSCLVADSELLFQTDSSPPIVDGVPTVPSLLECLIETIMFQVVVEFIKFVTSLGELLFHLSGCGITSRQKKHEIDSYARPVQGVNEFIDGAAKLVLAPIRVDLGKADESIDAVLFMADNFVRLGRLQTVREIEGYIITTGRHLACDYTSFIALVSSTLKRCLCASDRMTWDHIYPCSAIDQEDYSMTYIKKTEATEFKWAIQNLKKQDDENVNLVTINIAQTEHPITLWYGSDSSPLKKQRLSNPSPSSSNNHHLSATPASSSGGDFPCLPQVYCHYADCKKLYTGKDARVNLRRHIRTVHEKCKTIQCLKCVYNSSRRDNVRKHFLRLHKGEEVPLLLMRKTRA
ncbi:hypothetical protein B0O99DRAFT_152485 [Bisporella sp. PMI_857]|nr:hypothetical protein B0O99DRAFT_152485 [Bisporella sp. PMI_857]